MKEDRKINILYLIVSFDVGGAEKVIARTIGKLEIAKYNIFVAALKKGSENIINDFQSTEVQIVNLDMQFKYDIKVLGRLYSLLKRESIDLIYTFMFHPTILGRIVGKFAKIPIILSSVHTMKQQSNLRLKLDKLTSRLSDRIVVVSESVHRFCQYQCGIPKNKLLTIHNGIEVEKYHHNRTYFVEGNNVVVGCTSLLRKVNGHQYLIEADNLLRDRNISYRIVGSGDEEENLKALVNDMDLVNRIEFVGYRADIDEQLKTFDIYVQPALFAGFPYSVLEAMASGLPVIATDVGGTSEAIIDGKTGFLIPPRDSKAIAEKITYLIEHSDVARQIGQNAQAYVKKFSVENMVKQTDELFERVIQDKLGLVYHLNNEKKEEDTNSWIMELNTEPLIRGENKRKILRIIARLNIGGPAIHTTLLTAGLDRTRFASLLVAGVVGEGEGDMSYFASEYGVKPIIIPELGREIGVKNDLTALYKLFRLIKTEKPEILHTHTAKAGTVGRVAAILSGVPHIFHTFHGHVLHSYFGKFKTKLFIFIERLLARFTDKIIVISPLQYRELCHQIKIAPPKKFSIIPLGFDLTQFLNAEVHCGKLRRELHVSEDTLLVGIVGRLTAIKNHALFLRSAARVLEKVANVRFLIGGDGELATELKELANNLQIQDKVIFLGWRDDMPVIYADLDIVVLTSLNEGTPVSLIEAMASTKAVVATAVGGVPDIVFDGQTGILVPSGDEEKLSAAIIDLLEDAEKRRNLGKRGREFVKGKFTKERLFADMARLYEELLSAPKGNSNR